MPGPRTFVVFVVKTLPQWIFTSVTWRFDGGPGRLRDALREQPGA
jgi:hypothetical protein